jgi:hypothetical protein
VFTIFLIKLSVFEDRNIFLVSNVI